ncbi:hypothetical protein, partial [Escherichia coli]|uniref:hypothetical protein n=1 Tax=Escherichia coli TaxID=562 RepID=UPI003D313B44
MAEHGGEREIALSDLTWLTAEVTTVLPQTAQTGLPADVALIARLAGEERFKTLTFSPRGGGTGTNGQSLNTGIVV